VGKGRLEAFSDGVIAVALTIMVLDLKAPHGMDLAALRTVLPDFLSYVLSFVFVGIYWSNHHHLLHTVKHVTGDILWANLHLLFWITLFPFCTAWISEDHDAAVPTALYGFVLLMAALSWTILQSRILQHEGAASLLGRAVGADVKGKVSLLLYASAIPLAFAMPLLSDALYVFVAAMWLVPDRRIEILVKE
jgi:uncharacterized membrane protein